MGYTNSKLATYINISPNKTSSRRHAIDTITIHCMVAQWTAKTACDFFANKNRKASCNYAVGMDGSIGLCVEEKDASWCSSNVPNDHRAITIEVASDKIHPFAVTDKAYNALIELLVDVCKRNGIKELKWLGNKNLIAQVDRQNMTAHRWFKNKACPGDYLYNRFGDIARKVNEKMNNEKKDFHWARKNLDSLVKKGIIVSPEAHKNLDEPVSKGVFFTIIDRITDKE